MEKQRSEKFLFQKEKTKDFFLIESHFHLEKHQAIAIFSIASRE